MFLLITIFGLAMWVGFIKPIYFPPCQHQDLVLYRARAIPPFVLAESVVLAEEYPLTGEEVVGNDGEALTLATPVLLGSDEPDAYVVVEREVVDPVEATVMDARAVKEAFGLTDGRWKMIGVLTHIEIWVRVTPDGSVCVRKDFVKGWSVWRWCSTYWISNGKPVFLNPAPRPDKVESDGRVAETPSLTP